MSTTVQPARQLPQQHSARQGKLRLSAAVITLNEVHQLPKLIASLRFADEIVLIDGGSADGTAALAKQLGCRVLTHPFDNFAAQRNRAIDCCRGDWILSIDADERPTPAMIAELDDLLTNDSEHVAFRVPIRSRIFGRRMRFAGTQDDRPVRYFLRDVAHWGGEVHERLSIQGSIGQLRTHLEHTTLPDLHSYLRKMDRYTTLEAEARCEREQRPRWRDRWLSPLMEFGRRFLWKGGMLDGPEGWAFCALSGLSKWVEADKHRRMWRIANGHAVCRTMREHPQRRAQRAAPSRHTEDAPAKGSLSKLPSSLLPLLQEANARE